MLATAGPCLWGALMAIAPYLGKHDGNVPFLRAHVATCGSVDLCGRSSPGSPPEVRVATGGA